MSEKKFRKKVLEILAPVGAKPVENIVDQGMPDVVCVAGWLELKVAERPARPTTRVPVVVEPAQRQWWRRWRQHGGRVWTLTKLGEMWILHDGLWAAEKLGHATEDEMIVNASGCWPRPPTFEELIQKLTQQRAVN